ncbi:MAG TPA: GNAT family N-acetyltransferase, partial [Candidatus Brocadiia bacterium]|nr:GNAT family N-acetyltransferase [Candidatus Brocadiia bacterium]
MLEGPLPATVADFEGIVACANACFPPPPGMSGMEVRAAHCYINEPDHLSRFLVIKDNGRVVACLGCITQVLAVDGGEVRVSGVSGVATLPEYRGQGLMSRLLPAAVNLMRGQNCAFSELGGDR